MHIPRYSSAMVLAATVCLTGLGCRSGFQNVASCGCAEEPCELASCGRAEEPCELASCGCAEEPCELASCGCAEEPCELASCGCAEEPCELASCGCAEEPCPTIDCGNGIGCKQHSCGWWNKLLGCFKVCDCAGCGAELYWSEWHNNPPGCEPCDSCGHWIGPSAVYRAPYRTLPDLATEPRTTPSNEQVADFLVPKEEFDQDDLQQNDLTEFHLPVDEDEQLGDLSYEFEQTEGDTLILSLERDTIFR